MKPDVIKIDDVEYVKKDKSCGKIRIVVLQRGFIGVGYFIQEGSNCSLERAAHIRNWGTTKGLGEIAFGGPTPKTILDKCPTIRFHELTIIQTIDCVEEKWEKYL